MPSRLRVLPYFRLLLLAGFFLLAAGCGETDNRTVDKIRIVNGAEQCALPGEAFSQPLRIELLGPNEPGLLGGKGSRAPVAGAAVHFVPVDGSDLKVEPKIAKTDEGGGVTVTVTAGRTTGDQYLKIIPADFPGKAVTLRFITGMKITGNEKQYHTGTVGTRPISVKLIRPDGTPAAGVPVNFDLLATAEGSATTARILTPEAMTGADGVAETEVELGKKSGVYSIGISVSDPKQGFMIRDKKVRLLGFDAVGVVIAVLGGLALFVFGMIGKGARNAAVNDAMRQYGAVYFAATGGAGALIAQCVKKCDLVAFPDLGPEAIYRLEVEDFPLVVATDSTGNTLYR